MKTYPTKQDVINDLFSGNAIKVLCCVAIGFTALFLVYIRLATLAMMMTAWGLMFLSFMGKIILEFTRDIYLFNKKSNKSYD